ncbi:MAG: hypothetical protein JXR03_02250 [Cyclobacteriaceae bacterium]
MFTSWREVGKEDCLSVVFKYHAKFNKRVKERQFWTHENHAVELVNNEMIESRLDYIHENPVEQGGLQTLKITYIVVQEIIQALKIY